MATSNQKQFDPDDIDFRVTIYEKLRRYNNQGDINFTLVYQLCYPEDELQQLVEDSHRRSQVLNLIQYYTRGGWILRHDSGNYLSFTINPIFR